MQVIGSQLGYEKCSSMLPLYRVPNSLVYIASIVSADLHSINFFGQIRVLSFECIMEVFISEVR